MATPLVTDIMQVGTSTILTRKIELMTNSDYINGWDAGVLQKAVDNCHCNPYGDVSFNQCFFVFSLYQNI